MSTPTPGPSLALVPPAYAIEDTLRLAGGAIRDRRPGEPHDSWCPRRNVPEHVCACSHDVLIWLYQNARLIAAAPELLAALRTLLSVSNDHPDDETCECPECESARPARALLARIENGG